MHNKYEVSVLTFDLSVSAERAVGNLNKCWNGLIKSIINDSEQEIGSSAKLYITGWKYLLVMHCDVSK